MIMETFDNPRRREELKKVTEQAAEWYTLFEENPGTAEERAAFAQWIAESPLHVKAFLNVTAADRMVETVDIDWRPDSIATTLGALPTSLYVMPGTARHENATEPTRGNVRNRRRLTMGFGMAAAVTLAIGGWWLISTAGGKQTYITGIGEQRSVELMDGSVAHLNAKSRLEVRFSATARELRLLDGEALFKVQHQPARPFVVYVNDTAVQAIGTQFDVDRRRETTTVTVLEGVVQISSDTAPASRLAAGEAANVSTKGAVERAAAVNMAQVTAWRERRLVFEEDTLADIATEFNRYNRSPQLRIEDDAVRQRRYAAVFDADDPESLLQFLRKDPDLAFDARKGEIVIRAR